MKFLHLFFIFIFLVTSCATDKSYFDLGRYLASDPITLEAVKNTDEADLPGPRVNTLIENSNALQARHDVWKNPKANFFFMSSYEFEEDKIGLAQVRWAVENARLGKTVHILLDDSGHNLSDEVIYYMLENGVNVHKFSPTFSLRGIKHRYQTNRGLHNPIVSAFNAVFKQATFRMHDKILFNDAIEDEAKVLLDSEKNIGQLILGGRNARDSHYGLDDGIVIQSKEVKVPKGEGSNILNNVAKYHNPRHEIEHEVLVHAPKAHAEAQNYIDNILNSGFTERVDINKLRKRVSITKKAKEKWGNLWKAKTIENNLKFNNSFIEFSKDISKWIDIYNLVHSWEFDIENARDLANGFNDIIKRHSGPMSQLIGEGKLSPKFFVGNLKGMVPKEHYQILKKMSRNLEVGDEKAAKEFMDAVVTITQRNRDNIGGFLMEKGPTKLIHFERFRGPFSKTQAFSEKLANLLYRFLGLRFDLDKYDSIDNKLVKNKELMDTLIDPGRPNWIRKAVPVDDVTFIHDTVHDSLLEKRVMNHAWDIMGRAKGEITFNSQYGTPSPRAYEAMSTFLRRNSAMIRFLEQNADKGGVGVAREATEEFVDKFIQLVLDNENNISETLKGNTGSTKRSSSLRDVKRSRARKRFFKIMESLFTGDNKTQAILIKEQLKKNVITELEYVEKFKALIKVSREDIIQSVLINKERFIGSARKLKGYIDDDPFETLGKYEPNRLHFMSNDKESWVALYDDFVHDDFHLAMEDEWIDLGRGVDVYGFNHHGRIHSKVMTTGDEALVWSANLDYRSEYINTEVGAKITAQHRGNQVIKAYETHLQSYMFEGKKYIDDGRFVNDTDCPSLIRSFFIKYIMRPQL